MNKKKIPDHIFFIYGLKKQEQEFLFYAYLSILSAKIVNNPKCIYFYYHYEPFGVWWEKTKPLVSLKKIDIPTHWGEKKNNSLCTCC